LFAGVYSNAYAGVYAGKYTLENIDAITIASIPKKFIYIM